MKGVCGNRINKNTLYVVWDVVQECGMKDTIFCCLYYAAYSIVSTKIAVLIWV